MTAERGEVYREGNGGPNISILYLEVNLWLEVDPPRG